MARPPCGLAARDDRESGPRPDHARPGDVDDDSSPCHLSGDVRRNVGQGHASGKLQPRHGTRYACVQTRVVEVRKGHVHAGLQCIAARARFEVRRHRHE